jgi:hypothetical protein
MGVSLFAGCNNPNRAPEAQVDLSLPRAAQPRLQTVKLWLGPQEMTAEVAITEQQVRTGMMFRTNVDENEGMIFILPNTERAAFWMKNCFVPLSVAYIDPDGVIQEIHPLEPQNTNSVIAASENIRFALETKQDWFQRHNIGPGAIIRTERGSLRDTFMRGQ